MPFRPNFSSRFSGSERVDGGEEVNEEEVNEEEGLKRFGLGREKGRREAIDGCVNSFHTYTDQCHSLVSSFVSPQLLPFCLDIFFLALYYITMYLSFLGNYHFLH